MTRTHRVRAGHAIAALAVLAAVVRAWSQRWVCDDAFISYRYARNLVEGWGLVYNPGERVEGYSNFLWTLVTALGLRLGVSAEAWTVALGVLSSAGTVALLAWFWNDARRNLGLGAPFFPVAAVMAALFADGATWATGGLETSFFTLLAAALFVLMAPAAWGGRPRAVPAGAVAALLALTRPDGVVFGAAGFAALLLVARTGGGQPGAHPGAQAGGRERRARTVRAALTGALVLLVAVALHEAWRLRYYGDPFPNTYYAKSADRAWWSQGWWYLSGYVTRYWVLLAAAPALLLAWRTRAPRSLAVLAMLPALAYVLVITRMGGDFMFARLLVPATPLLLVAIEVGLRALAARRPRAADLAAAALVVAWAAAPGPSPGKTPAHGIIEERAYYGASLLDPAADTRSATLARYLADLPATVAFLGGEAHAMYRARVHTAIECETGLTDRHVARRELAARGRPGHEKNADPSYVIGERGAELTFHASAPGVLRLDEAIVPWRIRLEGAGGAETVEGFVLSWNPVLMAELARRGARFDDLPAAIDAWAAELPGKGAAERADLRRRLDLMYFRRVDDAQREARWSVP